MKINRETHIGNLVNYGHFIQKILAIIIIILFIGIAIQILTEGIREFTFTFLFLIVVLTVAIIINRYVLFSWKVKKLKKMME